MESKALEYQQRVREGFLAEARRHSDRIRAVDASGAVEVVQLRIREEFQRVLA